MDTFWQHISTRSQARLVPVLVCLCLVGCGSRSERVRPGKDAPVVELSIYEKDRRVQRGEKAEAAEAEKKRLAAEQMAAEQKKKDAAEAEEQRRAAEQMAAEQKKKDAAAATDRQRQAFEQLNELPDAVSLVDGSPVGLGGQKTLPVSIGNVSVDDLAEFEIALAKPENSGLQIVKSEADGDRSWTIEATVKRGLDEEGKKVTLATVYQVEGDGESTNDELVIKPASPSVADLREYKLLLRSALLLSATSPQDLDEHFSRQVNLIPPGRAESGVVSLGEKKKIQLEFGVPAVLWQGDSTNEALGFDALGFIIEVVSPCALEGRVEETLISLPQEMSQRDARTGSLIYDVPLLQTNLITCSVDIMLVPDLGKGLTAGVIWETHSGQQMQVGIRQALIEDDEDFRRAKEKSRNQLNEICIKICDISRCTVHEDVWKKQIEKEIRSSLGDPFLRQYFANQPTALSILLDRTAQKFVNEFDAIKLLDFFNELGDVQRQQRTLENCRTWWPARFSQPMQQLFWAGWQEYEQSVNAQRELLRPLVHDGVTVRIKKMWSTVVDSRTGTEYEIVLVDENAKPGGNSSHGKQNAAALD
ncbi:MAG: cell envelope integrity protein TolA [Pirellulales bacterium]